MYHHESLFKKCQGAHSVLNPPKNWTYVLQILLYVTYVYLGQKGTMCCTGNFCQSPFEFYQYFSLKFKVPPAI